MPIETDLIKEFENFYRLAKELEIEEERREREGGMFGKEVDQRNQQAPWNY